MYHYLSVTSVAGSQHSDIRVHVWRHALILRARNGNELLTFIPCAEPVLPDTDLHIPLTFTLIVAKHQDRVLLLYTSEREHWEVPGGGIEPNETPYDCAVRELFEETGQVADHLAFKGLFKVCLQPDQHMEYGALYAASLSEIRRFTANNEAERIMFWKEGDVLEGHFSEVSRAMLDFA